MALLIQLAPGKATVRQVSGTLLHGGTIKSLDYQYDTFSLSFDELKFHWQWSALLKQNFIMNAIEIKNLQIHLPQSSSDSSNNHSYSIHLPVNIFLKNILLDNVTIYNKKSVYFIKRLRLSGDLENNIITLHELFVLTPDFYTHSQGKIDINTWSHIGFLNEFTLTSRQDIPIYTKITGDKNTLMLNIQSVKWLNVNLILKNYLQSSEKISLISEWFIDTTKTNFPELKKLNGKLQFSGHANGLLLQPKIDGKLLAQNLHYEANSIKKLTGTFNFSLDKQKEVALDLSGNDIYFGETLLNNVRVSILGTVTSHKIKATLQMLDSYLFSFATQAGFVNKNYYFKQGKFNIGPLNIILNPISFNVNFDKNKAITYDATIQHHNEKLTLQGDVQYDDLLHFEAKTSLSSNKFTIIDTDAYKIIINPALFLNYNNEVTKIKGTLNVLSANISPIDFSNTVTLTSDIVYVNNQNKPLYQKSSPLQLFIDVLVNIKHLAINYKGVNAEISGETKLTQTPATELNAYGQLQILKGSYKAYGQILTIQKESVINFNREIDNPLLNITASKNIKVSPEYLTLPSYQPYLIAGVQVTGTANEPNIHLFSLPSGISQQDILSYLIFGFPQSQLSKSQTNAIWSAFNMIDTGNSSFSLTGLQKNIQNEFGFSEFGLGSTSEFNADTQQYESGTAFVVGKRITDNLTATYNMGLLVPVNVLYLRYRLSQHWALQSDSSALGNGGDILYTIRRD